MTTDSPDVVIAKRLLDYAKLSGFEFRRVAPGEDAPLVGHRIGDDCVDLIHLEGFSHDCFAWRKRTSSLVRTVLREVFAGTWGADPTPQAPANARVIRATDIDSAHGINVATAALRRLSVRELRHKKLRTGDLIIEASGVAGGECADRSGMAGTVISMDKASIGRCRIDCSRANAWFRSERSQLGWASLSSGRECAGRLYRHKRDENGAGASQ